MSKILTSKIQEILEGDIDTSVSPDIGRAKWTRAYAKALGIDEAVIDKVRISGSETTGYRVLVGDQTVFFGKNLLIQDDLTVTCGSLKGAGEIVQKYRPKSVTACISHLPTAKGAITNLRESGMVNTLVVSNSHYNALRDAKELSLIHI